MCVTRFCMILSSISPLFILWAIRGNSLLPDKIFLLICAAIVITPNLFLLLRIRTSKRNKEIRSIVVGSAEDHREHLLVYLFAVLAPFYAPDSDTWREFIAVLTALCFVVFLFWHLSLDYMNLFFALFQYRIFTVYPPQDGNPHTGRQTFAIITKRKMLRPGLEFKAYRLSNTVYLELK